MADSPSGPPLPQPPPLAADLRELQRRFDGIRTTLADAAAARAALLHEMYVDHHLTYGQMEQITGQCRTTMASWMPKDEAYLAEATGKRAQDGPHGQASRQLRRRYEQISRTLTDGHAALADLLHEMYVDHHLTYAEIERLTGLPAASAQRRILRDAAYEAEAANRNQARPVRVPHSYARPLKRL